MMNNSSKEFEIETAKQHIEIAVNAHNALVLQIRENNHDRKTVFQTLSMCHIILISNIAVLLKHKVAPNFNIRTV